MDAIGFRSGPPLAGEATGTELKAAPDSGIKTPPRGVRHPMARAKARSFANFVDSLMSETK
jgi:hypothetical protein